MSMAMADYFYVTLPSNSSMTIYPENKVNHFKTKLNKPIVLTGNDWEVGLAEISYPQAWYNVQKGNLRWRIERSLDENAEGPLLVLSKTEKYYLPAGAYRNPHILIQRMKTEMQKRQPSDITGIYSEDALDLSYDEVSSKINIVVGAGIKERAPVGRHYFVQFNKELSDVLGLAKKETAVLLPEGTYQGQDIVDLSQDVHSMYVYCNMVEPQVVGDYHAPLLRTVPLVHMPDTPHAINQIFNHIYFLPMSQKEISTIEIDIRDDVGRPVAFERGRLIVTLVFKKRLSVGFYW